MYCSLAYDIVLYCIVPHHILLTAGLWLPNGSYGCRFLWLLLCSLRWCCSTEMSDKWAFLRYLDKAWHLRLRLYVRVTIYSRARMFHLPFNRSGWKKQNNRTRMQKEIPKKKRVSAEGGSFSASSLHSENSLDCCVLRRILNIQIYSGDTAPGSVSR